MRHLPGGFVEAQAHEGGEPGKSDETGAIVKDSAEKRPMERETSQHSVSTASQMEKQISQASEASALSIISVRAGDPRAWPRLR
eukprot:s2789_g2.t2